MNEKLLHIRKEFKPRREKKVFVKFKAFKSKQSNMQLLEVVNNNELKTIFQN